MKKFQTHALLLILTVSVWMFACRQETCLPDPSLKGGIKTLMMEWLANRTQSFEVEASSPRLLIGSQGTRIRFRPNSFRDASGNLVLGKVKIELVEIYDKATMAMLDKPTLGVRGSSFVPLVSAGSFFIQATQNGNRLVLSIPATVSSKADQIDSSMSKFNGLVDSVGQVRWQIAPDSTLTPQLDTATITPLENISQKWYSYPFDGSYSWVNCDKFYYLPGAPTSVKALLPTGYSNLNSRVYLSFDGIKSIVSMFPDVAEGFTIGSSYSLPEGTKVTFVVIAFRDEKIEYAIRSSTLTANHLETISDLIPTSEQDLKRALSELP